MKKVTFSEKPPAAPQLDIDRWVKDRSLEALESKEAMKRLTIDVPLSLHKRIKSQCALQDLVMADVVRELLEQRFAEAVGQGVPT